MRVVVNGAPRVFEHDLSVEEILHELHVHQEFGVAVAVNASVVSRSEFAVTRIKDGDSVEIIHATAGG